MELAGKSLQTPLTLLDIYLDKSYLWECPFTLSWVKSVDWEDKISPASTLRSILWPDENILDGFISIAVLKGNTIQWGILNSLLETQSSSYVKERQRQKQATELLWQSTLLLISWAKLTACVHTSGPLQLQSKTRLDHFQSSSTLHLWWPRNTQTTN